MQMFNFTVYGFWIFFLAPLFAGAQLYEPAQPDTIVYRESASAKFESRSGTDHSKVVISGIQDNTLAISLKPGETIRRERIYLSGGAVSLHSYSSTISGAPSFLSFSTIRVYCITSIQDVNGTIYTDFTLSADANATGGQYTIVVSYRFNSLTGYLGTSVLTLNVSVVIPPPLVDFTANPLSGAIPLTVHFNNLSTGSIASYLWDFGDGSSSTLTNPSHIYSKMGTWTVKLTAEGPGGTANKQISNYISSRVPAPVADFSANPASGLVPFYVQFTNQSTGDITNYLWNFGDGETSNLIHPNHLYDRGGQITAKLTATGPGGSSSKTMSIYAEWPVSIWNILASKTAGEIPLLVQFYPTVAGQISTYRWEFGDGGTSNELKASHTYTNTGTWIARLTVEGPKGTDSKTITITASAPTLKAAFYGTPTSGVVPLLVQFYSQSTANVTRYQWDFGDGTNSDLANPSHIYRSPGDWSVDLTVTGPLGTTTVSKSKYISSQAAALTADFTISPATGSIPLLVKFASQTTGTISTYLWNFGDGTTSNSPNPSHTYIAAGSWMVVLTVSGPSGTITVQKQIRTLSTGVLPIAAETVRAFALLQNYPNPFNGSTNIYFQMPEADYLQITIRDMLGRNIRTLVDEFKTGHSYFVTWDGCDDRGHRVPAGVYLCQLINSYRVQTIKMALVN